MESSGCSRCIGLRSVLIGLSVLLQDCNSVSPLYANLHCFPRPAPAKKYGRNLYTPHRQTPFHYARPSADTEPQDNDGRQRDRELQLKRYPEPMAHGPEACEPSHPLWPMIRRPASRHTRAEAVDTGYPCSLTREIWNPISNQ